MSLFPNVFACVFLQLVQNVVSRYQVPANLSGTKPDLKFCEVPNYYEQVPIYI